MNRHVRKKYCRGRHSSSITHLAGQRQGSCAHGFAQGKNNIPGRLPADPVPRLSFVACCPRPLPFLSPPSGASASQCCSRAGSQEWLSRVHRNRAAAKVGHRSASRLRTSSAGGRRPASVRILSALPGRHMLVLSPGPSGVSPGDLSPRFVFPTHPSASKRQPPPAALLACLGKRLESVHACVRE